MTATREEQDAPSTVNVMIARTHMGEKLVLFWMVKIFLLDQHQMKGMEQKLTQVTMKKMIII